MPRTGAPCRAVTGSPWIPRQPRPRASAPARPRLPRHCPGAPKRKAAHPLLAGRRPSHRAQAPPHRRRLPCAVAFSQVAAGGPRTSSHSATMEPSRPHAAAACALGCSEWRLMVQLARWPRGPVRASIPWQPTHHAFRLQRSHRPRSFAPEGRVERARSFEPSSQERPLQSLDAPPD